jgi:very-short-patch-repair endonuclease
VDQEALKATLEELTGRYCDFREAVTQAGRGFDLRIVFDSGGKLSKMSTTDFAKWIGAELSKLERRLDTLNRLGDLLKPGQDASLADLPSRLQSFEALRQVNLRSPTDHLLFRQDGELDRERTTEGLRAAEQLDSLIKVFPELREVLVDQGRLDQEALKVGLDELTTRYRDFSTAVSRVNRDFDLRTVFGSDSKLSRISTADFAKWIGEELSRLEKRFATMDRLGALIKPGRDVSLADLPSRVQSLDALRQANSRQPADDLVLREDGELDWEQTTEGLRAAEQFDPLVRVFPELREVLVDRVRVDQEALEASLEELSKRYGNFDEAVGRACRHYDLATVLSQEGQQSKISVADFAEWLETASSKLERRLAALHRLCALLRPSQDVLLPELPERLRSIEKLHQARSHLASLAARLGLPDTDLEPVQDRDWTDLRSKAEWTIGFLDNFADRPPEPLIRAATDPEFRQQLSDSVQRNVAVRTNGFMEGWDFLTKLFDPEQDVSTGIQVGLAPIPRLLEWVEHRIRDAHLIQEWVKFSELRAQITEARLGSILPELFEGRFAVEDARDAFLVRFYRSWLDWVYEQDAALRRFTTETHERLIDQFRDLDRDLIRLSHTRIRASLLGDPARPTATSLGAPNSSELGTLQREVQKKRRLLPLRRLFARIPTILTRLKPCLMMSPLAVSTYFNTRDTRFDLVIFDEASQVRPHDAISAIYRGRQLVVAGDQKQLPPTNFFERTMADEELMSDEDEVEETLSDFESILDVCRTLRLTHCRLRWHYRSRREPLIAFSNRHFYDNELVTFPSVFDTGDAPAIRFEYVSNGRWKSGSNGGFNAVEADRIAQLIMRHFSTEPSRSLGVVAFSQRQQIAILDQLERLRKAHRSLEMFFSEDREEPFFVKNLENVQGDERDVIFLSVGYGPDENGRIAMRFGPLNREGGQRRLNVAVTRAREAMTIVSSMKAQNIDPTRTNSVGAKLLRAYLDFAERGITALGSDVTQVNEHDYDSPFEREVAEALIAHGLEVRKQVGCSGYRIDLAVVDPQSPGRFLLGIECDGATYHRSATARDRDRLRQEVLESLGWTIVRIWSTDWVQDPLSQIDRVVAQYDRVRSDTTASHPSRPDVATPEHRLDEIPLDVVNVRPKSPSSAIAFQNIDEVSDAHIKDLLLALLGNYGATEEEDLKQAVTRQLGFQRMGRKIRTRIEGCIEGLIFEKKISRTDDDSLKLNSAPGLRHA